MAIEDSSIWLLYENAVREHGNERSGAHGIEGEIAVGPIA
jgi:hypothetical protein